MKATKISAVLLLTVAFLSCDSRIDRTGSGGVILSISDFDGLPIAISVNASAGGFVQVGEIQISNVVKNQTLAGSDLMNVEIQSYEVIYTRADNGTIVPTPFVRGLFGVAPAGGTFTVDNLPVMAPEQFNAKPLSDLLFQNGGFDKETGETVIIMNFHIKFFGRTLSGDAVATEPASFTVTITP